MADRQNTDTPRRDRPAPLPVQAEPDFHEAKPKKGPVEDFRPEQAVAPPTRKPGPIEPQKSPDK